MNLTDPIFIDETKAREHFEAIRWPDGPYCPHCGETERVYRLQGKSHRPGLLYCNSCNGSFTVTTGSVMESSHVPLNKWALAFRLLCSSKKGVSAHQLHRTLGVSYKTAWFMAHRIREAMRPDEFTPMGGKGQIVEADETLIGSREGEGGKKAKRRRASMKQGGYAHKNVVLTLVERGGSARSFHIESTSIAQIVPILRTNIRRESDLMTDESLQYKAVGKEYASHSSVVHSEDEYVKGGYYPHQHG